MTATARRLNNGLTHEVDVNGRHTLLTDEPERLGGHDRGPAPHELLAATLASCVSTTVALYAHNHGWEIDAISVHVEYDPESVPRLLAVSLSLPVGLTSPQRDRLARVAASCPVRRALEAGFCFEERTIAAEAPRAA